MYLQSIQGMEANIECPCQRVDHLIRPNIVIDEYMIAMLDLNDRTIDFIKW